MKKFEVYKNGTQQGELEANSLKEAKNIVFATYGEERDVFEVEDNEMVCYIKYLDAKNKFKETIKEFITYDDAKKWLFDNIEKPNLDTIKFY